MGGSVSEFLVERHGSILTFYPVLRRVQDLTEEYPKVEALSPAKGIIRAIGLSVMLWCLIIPVIYWIRLSL
jgi:hypothetical protein